MTPLRYRSSASASPFLDNLSSCASWREPSCQHLPSRHVAAKARPEQRCVVAFGTMPLIYAFVSRGTTVLADYTSYTGNFSTVAIQCLEKCPPDNSKFTFTCDRHTFNYLVDGGFSKQLLSALVACVAVCVMMCRIKLTSSANPSLWWLTRAMAGKCRLRSWRRLEKSSSKSLLTKAELRPHTAWTNHLGESLYNVPSLLLTPLTLLASADHDSRCTWTIAWSILRS